MRWGLQHGTAVIPRASSESHLRSNLEALDWELPSEDYKALSSFEFQVSDPQKALTFLGCPGHHAHLHRVFCSAQAAVVSWLFCMHRMLLCLLWNTCYLVCARHAVDMQCTIGMLTLLGFQQKGWL